MASTHDNFSSSTASYTSPAQDASSASDPLQLEGAIWFQSGQQKWGNQRRMALLDAIGTQGSISAAAKFVGLSYKAAWDAVDAMNNLAGEPLVLRTTGGQRGGGATLTQRAQQLLQLYQTLQREHERFMTHLAAAGNADGPNLELIQHMMTQVSIRNRLAGTVQAVRDNGVSGDVTLALNDEQAIVASITQESIRNLGLAPGKRALALIKASSVMIGLPASRDSLSVRNQLPGRITRIQTDAHNAEVSLSLSEGHTITATLERAEFDGLKLKEGDEALAIIPAAQVMVGVLD